MVIPIFKEDEILYKEIVTMDNIILGYVAAIDYNDLIIISKGTKQEYKIPKSRIIRYSDIEILLDIMFKELDRYMVD
jgi:hypothetical protein